MSQRKTANDEPNNQMAISSTTKNEKQDGNKISTLYMTQEFVTKDEICQPEPSVTTALLTDYNEMENHEMKVMPIEEYAEARISTANAASNGTNGLISINSTNDDTTERKCCQQKTDQDGGDRINISNKGKFCCLTNR